MKFSHIGALILLVPVAVAQPRGAFSVGSVSAAPGRLASGMLKVGTGADIPISVIHGAKPGPVLTLVAGIHGYEYSPILALQRMRTKISPEALSGTVILVHVANMPSFLRRTIYYGPEDGQNLNRVFPGKADGTVSERIAHVLTTGVIARADYLIDLHCGDGNESLRPYAYWMRTGNPAVDERSRQMAVAFGLEHIVIDDERPRDPARSQYCSNTAATRGKPAITVESGGLGAAPAGLHAADDAINKLEAGVLRILRRLRMLSGAEAAPATKPAWIVRNTVLRSEATGIFYPEVHKDQEVRQGALLGTVTDFFGNKAFELRAPFAGKVLYVIATPPISAGEPLAMIGAAGPPPGNASVAK
jgi:predicted deacylase